MRKIVIPFAEREFDLENIMIIANAFKRKFSSLLETSLTLKMLVIAFFEKIAVFMCDIIANLMKIQKYSPNRIKILIKVI